MRSTSASPGGIGSLAAYQCFDQVGEGTYGYVYKARDKRTNEIVALKRLILSKESSGFPLCAVREIKFLKSLQHKNIVLLKDVVTAKGCEHLELPVQPKKILDFKESDLKGADPDIDANGEDEGKNVLKLCGNLYFVFEFVDHDLAGLIDSKYKFSPRAIKCIMRQLFEVLDFLNDRKIVHRDIKTSNILISNRYQLKLADFGLARSLQSADGRDLKIDMTNNVITLWYRPPELLLGTVRYSSAVDVWSAGCVLAELELTRPLFPGKTEVEQLEVICRVIGTLSEDLYPGVSKLPHFDTMVRPMQKYVSTIKSAYNSKMSAPALNLLERILVADPLRRSSAKIALTNKYFHTQPMPPTDPTEMEPMSITDGASFHEYKTKQMLKAKDAESKKAAGGSDSTGAGSAEATSEQPEPSTTANAAATTATTGAATEVPLLCAMSSSQVVSAAPVLQMPMPSMSMSMNMSIGMSMAMGMNSMVQCSSSSSIVPNYQQSWSTMMSDQHHMLPIPIAPLLQPPQHQQQHHQHHQQRYPDHFPQHQHQPQHLGHSSQDHDRGGYHRGGGGRGDSWGRGHASGRFNAGRQSVTLPRHQYNHSNSSYGGSYHGNTASSNGSRSMTNTSSSISSSQHHNGEQQAGAAGAYRAPVPAAGSGYGGYQHQQQEHQNGNGAGHSYDKEDNSSRQHIQSQHQFEQGAEQAGRKRNYWSR